MFRCRSLFFVLALLTQGPSVATAADSRATRFDPLPSEASRSYATRNWTVDDGLPQSSVTCLAQSLDGYLWVGTRNGLARFDGVRFVSFGPANTPALSSGRVSGLHADRAGSLWVVTEGGGVARYQQGVFLRLLPETVPARREEVRPAFYESRFSHLWMSLEYGCVHRWDGHTLHAIEAPPECAEAVLVPVGEAPRGGMWFWLRQEKELYHFADDKWTPVSPTWGLTGRHCLGFTWDQDRTLWIATENEIARWVGDGLRAVPGGELEAGLRLRVLQANTSGSVWVEAGYRLRRYADAKWIADTGRLPTGPGPVNASWTDHEGGLWVSFHGGGLFRVSPDGEWHRFAEFPGGSADEVLCMLQDREGNMWVGGESSGLVRLRPRLFTLLDAGGHLPLSLCCDSQGALWLGSRGGGLRRLLSGRFAQFHFGLDASPGSVWSVFAGPRDTIWAGTWYNGVFVKGNEGFVRAIDPGTVNGPVLALHQDTEGTLWIGTAHGLYASSNGNVTSYAGPDGVRPGEVRAIATDAHQRVWCGGAGGLYCLRGQSFSRCETAGLQGGLGALFLGADDILWAGGLGGSLAFLRDERWVQPAAPKALADGAIYGLMDDKRGYLWMSTSRGIYRAQRRALLRVDGTETDPPFWDLFDAEDGLPSRECSGGFQPSIAGTGADRLFFPTVKGVVAVRPSQVAINPIPPCVVVEEVRVNGREARFSSASGRGPEKAPPWRIGPGVQRLEFIYTGLSFVAPERVHFRHRLDRYDTEWQDAGNQRRAHYSRLPPGSYTFRVRACNNSGVWSSQDAQFAFLVQPHYWETALFRFSLLVFAVTGVASSVYWGTRRRLHRKVEALKTQQALQRERLRIAHDIHDDVGAGLTRVSLLSQHALATAEAGGDPHASLGSIYATTRSLTASLDEIVWAVNPRHDNLESLVSFLAHWAREFLEPAGVKFRQDIPLQLPPWDVNAPVRHSLFLAVKEALNNALKHARARVVVMALAVTGRGMALSISDDGVGFPAPASKPDTLANPVRNGLSSMQQRLAEAGGSCVIESAPGKGTRVTFAIDLNP